MRGNKTPNAFLMMAPGDTRHHLAHPCPTCLLTDPTLIGMTLSDPTLTHPMSLREVSEVRVGPVRVGSVGVGPVKVRLAVVESLEVVLGQ